MKQESTLEKITGTWKLNAIYFLFNDGSKEDMYGPNPIGILMYDSNGYMNAQLGESGRQTSFKNKEWMLDLNLKSIAFDSYMSYYGTYYEEEPGKVIHQVEGCINPDWIGEKEIRYVDTQGDILKIWTPKTQINGKEAVVEVLWQRVLN